MVRTMTATEAKAKLLALLDDVASGQEIEITKHGRVVGRLVPARGPATLEGAFAGLVRAVGRDEDLYSTGEQWTVHDDRSA